MGTYAKANITVEFQKAPPLELTKIQDLLQDYIGKDNYINAHNVEMYEEVLTFDLDSSRSQNLEYQVDQVIQFFKDSNYETISLNSDAYIQMESACWFLDEDDLNWLDSEEEE